MGRQTRLFGYWIAVDDAEDAGQAVRMAGLPVLVMGGNAVLLALTSFVNGSRPIWIAALIVALVLVVVAFRLRAGRAGWVPVAAALFGVFLMAVVGLTILEWRLLGAGSVTGLGLATRLVVPSICAVLAVNGLRGWAWLRRQGIRSRI